MCCHRPIYLTEAHAAHAITHIGVIVSHVTHDDLLQCYPHVIHVASLHPWCLSASSLQWSSAQQDVSLDPTIYVYAPCFY